MASSQKILFTLFIGCMCIAGIMSKSIGQGDKILFPSQFDIADDDGSVETALMNYLFARQMVNRMRNNMDISELQRKRTYWKQCAFNAVSCFGKK